MRRKKLLIFILIFTFILIGGCSDHDHSIDKINKTEEYTVSGKIVDSEGNGVSGVTIKFSNEFGTVTTEENGQFTKTGLRGEVKLTPVKEGYGFDPESRTVSKSNNNANFTVILIMPETTKVIEEESRKEVVEATDSKLVFSSETNKLKSISSGDVIVSKPCSKLPNGALRKVKSKSAQNDKVVLETEMASLDQAVESGNFHKEITLTTSDIEQTNVLVQGMEVEPSAINKEINLTGVLYDKDGDYDTKYDQITADGTFTFTYDLVLDASVVDNELENFVIKSVVDSSQELEISSGVSLSKEIDKEIAHFEFPNITFTIGPLPVTISPEVDIKAGVNGEVGAALTTSAKLSEQITAGLEYNANSWEPIADASISFDYSKPHFETTLQCTPYVGPMLSTKIYEVAGPNVELQGYSRLEGDPTADIWWKLYAGVDSYVGAEIEALSHNIANYEEQVLKREKLYAEANVKPKLDSLTDKTIKAGNELSFKVTASDANTGDDLTFSASGDLTEHFNSSTQIFSWKPDSSDVGNYTIDFKVTDGEKTDTGTVNITVEEANTPPEINLSKTTNNLTATLTGSVTDSEGNISELTINWDDGNTSQITSGFDNIEVSHTYQTGGSYTIIATAVDEEGESSTSEFPVQVEKAGEEVITNFTGHTSSVYSVDVYGTSVVSGSADNTVKVWGLDTGEVLTNLTHTGKAKAVAFSPDGSLIAAGSSDNTVKVWAKNTGELLTNFTEHSKGVSAVSFSPDGKKVVTGSNDRTAKVWNVETGEVLVDFTAHTASVYSVDFSPDGTRIVSGSEDETVKIWDADTGEVLKSFEAISDPQVGSIVDAVDFSPDGEKIVVGESTYYPGYNGVIKVWEPATENVVTSFTKHNHWIEAVAFSPDGSKIVSGSEDNTVKVWDTVSGEVLKEYVLETEDGVSSVVFSEDGNKIIFGSYDGTVKVWRWQ